MRLVTKKFTRVLQPQGRWAPDRPQLQGSNPASQLCRKANQGFREGFVSRSYDSKPPKRSGAGAIDALNADASTSRWQQALGSTAVTAGIDTPRALERGLIRTKTWTTSIPQRRSPVQQRRAPRVHVVYNHMLYIITCTKDLIYKSRQRRAAIDHKRCTKRCTGPSRSVQKIKTAKGTIAKTIAKTWRSSGCKKRCKSKM